MTTRAASITFHIVLSLALVLAGALGLTSTAGALPCHRLVAEPDTHSGHDTSHRHANGTTAPDQRVYLDPAQGEKAAPSMAARDCFMHCLSAGVLPDMPRWEMEPRWTQLPRSRNERAKGVEPAPSERPPIVS